MRRLVSFAISLKPYLFEPAFILFNLGQGIAELTDVNLYLQKTCRQRSGSEPDLRTPCDDLQAGVDFVATVNSRYLFASSAATVAFTVLMSAWNDRGAGRRKFCILFAMTAKLLQLTSMCLQSYYWHWPALAAVYTEAALHSASCLRVASIIYICSVTTSADRTFRLTLLYMLMVACLIISSGLSGYALRNLGFLRTYVVCWSLVFVAVLHLAFFVADSSATAAAATAKRGRLRSVFDFFDVRSVWHAFKLVFRKRDGNERVLVSLLSLTNILAWIPYLGERSVLYLYLRYRFGWNEQDYGFYLLYKLFGITVGSCFCMVLTKRLKMADSAIGTFAAFWDILAAVGLFFATERWHLYFIPLLDIFHGFALNVSDSLRSKLFESHEFGRLFSVHVALFMAVTFSFPAYNILFRCTKDVAPGSIFLLSSAINASVCVLYGICHMMLTRGTSE